MKPNCLKVVVVEDDFLLRLDIALHLESEGYDVLAAGTADEAMELLPDLQPVDLLMTDVQMPGKLDGLKLAAEVLRRWPETRVIIASAANCDPSTIPEAATYLPKPYGLSDVTQSIEHLCGTRH